MNNIYIENIKVIKKRFITIYEELERSVADDSYFGVEKSKTNEYCVPFLKDGNLLHSKYSYVKESERMFSGNEDSVLFCGIGAGFHIQYFLQHFDKKKALIFEASYPALKALLALCDLSELLRNENVILLPPITSSEWKSVFLQNYIPSTMGSLSIKPLRVWKDYFFPGEHNILDEKIFSTLEVIKQDASTQARFGRIWMRNIMLNLHIASQIRAEMPKVDSTKIAYILGAGPSLEDAFEEIKEQREKIVLFATDAAFLPLLKNGIVADFFISIDPQIACSTHCICPLPNNTIAIFDLSSSPALVRQFLNNGNRIIFTASDHPFAQYATFLSPFPKLEIKGGTVSIAALNVAFSLGFREIECKGLDFAYTKGKAYTKGAYLSDGWQSCIGRLKSEESLTIELMFRGKIEKIANGDGIIYRSELFDSYKSAFYNTKNTKQLWKDSDFSVFPYKIFVETLKSEVFSLYNSKNAVFLPFIMWELLHKGISKESASQFIHNLLDLAIQLS